ncbi:alpha-glucan family phosphorylase [Myxococcota bacterium]|nr:alpha-glucan family phosphorylase [Myxococcota bacterium]
MKPKLRTVVVTPTLPEPLVPLRELAYNLFWDWQPEISSLFRRLDPKLWEQTGHNPVALLGQIDQRRLEQLAGDIGFLAHLSRAHELLRRYKTEPRWFQTQHGSEDLQVAYFSAEFGLAGCMPIYSGGLGVLAGDHLKSASDLGVPLTGVGLLYQEGYFRQYLNNDGWQLETYPPNDFYNMPLTVERHADGTPVRIYVEFPGRWVWAQVWRVDVGRVPLYLLDTNVPENSPQDRTITRALYSGGVELRIQQLMMLGIGGYRALVAMGREPTICHMNEGHAGFLGVERVRMLMKQRSMSYDLARDVVEEGNIFTTHTPVPAGFDVFSRDLVERYMSDYIRTVGISIDEFISLGRRDRDERRDLLNMAILAIRHSVRRNGVSQLHGKVSRKLVQDGGAWTDWPEREVPIEYVTNGIHTHTWTSPEMAALFDRYLGPAWRDEAGNPRTWDAVEQIPAEELWRTHVGGRQQLVAYVRKRLQWQLERRGAPERELQAAQLALDPDALTIGFARRVATYKRATLFFRDLDRLRALIGAKDRPVQFVFAGKAHPADTPAKEFIKEIASKIKDPTFARSIIFLEDYEIEVAKHLVHGVDVWLNTPQRPREASGTSGMKVVPNGGLNLSILDGWWAEGYAPGLGWAIGAGEDWEESRDDVEAKLLYTLLETDVVPLFFDRDARGCPNGWVKMMKASIRHLAPQFSTDRMVSEYAERLYLPTAKRYRTVSSDAKSIEELAQWKRRIRDHWHEVQVLDVSSPGGHDTHIDEPFPIHARVRLGSLSPSDVEVQVFFGVLDAKDETHDEATTRMIHVGGADGVHMYTAAVPFSTSGRYGYTVRVIPSHEQVLVPHEIAFIRWA